MNDEPKAAPLHRRKMTRDSIGFAFTQYLVRAIMMARGFVGAKLLGPMSFGAWNALQLMMDYGVFAPIGTQQGLDQMVPGRIVEGDPVRLERLKRAALFNTLLLSGLFILGCMGWASWGSSRLRAAWTLRGVGLALLCVVFTNVSYYAMSVLRSHGRIAPVSAWFVWQGLVGAGFGLVLILPLDRWGLLWGWFAGCTVAMLWVLIQARGLLPLRPRASIESLDLVQIGFPLYVFNASSLVTRTIDRLVVLRFLGTQALGTYSLSVNVLTLVLALPDSIAYVAYPRMLRTFSEAGGRPESIRDMVVRLARGISLALPLLAGLALIWARDLVTMVLPKYADGVPPMRVLAFGATGLALSTLASIVLMTVGRRLVLIPAALFLAALSGALEVAALQLKSGLEGIAWATLIAYFLSGSVLLALASASVGLTLRQAGRFMTQLVVPSVLAFGLAWSIDHWLGAPAVSPWTSRIAHAGLGSLLFAAAFIVLCAPLARGAGLRQLVVEFQIPVLSKLLRRATDASGEGDGPR